MTPYHLTGAISAAFYALALAGLGFQLRTIWARRDAVQRVAGHATALLSLNYFAVSFLAYFSFFVYGFSITPFNHYLVWTRLPGCALVLAVLVEIARDRRSPASRLVAGGASGLLVAGLALLGSDVEMTAFARLGPQLLAVLATGLVSQSLVHQILLVRRAGHVGAVAWRLHFLTLLKDLSLVAFGLAMGLGLGWPLVVMGGASAALKLVLLRELYRSPAPAPGVAVLPASEVPRPEA